jgi:hypothetical protein|tara:strand:- start:2760 stop:3062 length:303 start_codon:yes stop_codon:yes gene_type:complete
MAKSMCPIGEFRDWVAYYQLDPWGEERADLRSGIVASVFSNAIQALIRTVARKRGKGKEFKPKDFMPEFGKKRRQSSQQMQQTLMAFTAAHKMMGKKPKK